MGIAGECQSDDRRILLPPPIGILSQCVIIHEYGHKKFCDITKTIVYRVIHTAKTAKVQTHIGLH